MTTKIAFLDKDKEEFNVSDELKKCGVKKFILRHSHIVDYGVSRTDKAMITLIGPIYNYIACYVDGEGEHIIDRVNSCGKFKDAFLELVVRGYTETNYWDAKTQCLGCLYNDGRCHKFKLFPSNDRRIPYGMYKKLYRNYSSNRPMPIGRRAIKKHKKQKKRC